MFLHVKGAFKTAPSKLPRTGRPQSPTRKLAWVAREEVKGFDFRWSWIPIVRIAVRIERRHPSGIIRGEPRHSGSGLNLRTKLHIDLIAPAALSRRRGR